MSVKMLGTVAMESALLPQIKLQALLAQITSTVGTVMDTASVSIHATTSLAVLMVATKTEHALMGSVPILPTSQTEHTVPSTPMACAQKANALTLAMVSTANNKRAKPRLAPMAHVHIPTTRMAVLAALLAPVTHAKEGTA